MLLDNFWQIQEYVYLLKKNNNNLLGLLIDRYSDYPFTRIFLLGFNEFGDKLSLCVYKDTAENSDEETIKKIKDKIDKCLPCFYLGV